MKKTSRLLPVIMAGGKGTRMSASHPDMPKPMIPLCGKPILQWQLECLVRQGHTRIVLVVGHMAQQITGYFGDGSAFGAQLEYIVEEEPLGTGGALALLPRTDILLLMGDVYLDVDFTRFEAFHYEKKSAITLFSHPNSHPKDSDLLVTDGNACVTRWVSKKEENRKDLRNLVNAGLYILSAQELPERPERLDLDAHIVSRRINSGQVYAYRSTEYVKDMGTPERLRSVEGDLKNGVCQARMLGRRQRAFILDRDGVLNLPNGFINSPEQMVLMPGVAQAIERLNHSEYLAICATNQPVVARGEASFETLEAIHGRLDELLAQQAGSYLDDLFFCPHHPDKGYVGEIPELKIPCECRKPRPGMLLQAAEKYNIDLSRSYMVGDSPADILAGRAAGCTTIGIDASGQAFASMKAGTEPHHVLGSLLEAVGMVLD